MKKTLTSSPGEIILIWSFPESIDQQHSSKKCSPGSYVTTLEIFQHVKPEVALEKGDISDRITTAS